MCGGCGIWIFAMGLAAMIILLIPFVVVAQVVASKEEWGESWSGFLFAAAIIGMGFYWVPQIVIPTMTYYQSHLLPYEKVRELVESGDSKGGFGKQREKNGQGGVETAFLRKITETENLRTIGKVSSQMKRENETDFRILQREFLNIQTKILQRIGVLVILTLLIYLAIFFLTRYSRDIFMILKKIGSKQSEGKSRGGQEMNRPEQAQKPEGESEGVVKVNCSKETASEKE